MITLKLPDAERKITVDFQGEKLTVTIREPKPQDVSQFRINQYIITAQGTVSNIVNASIALVKPILQDITDISIDISGQVVEINKNTKLTEDQKALFEKTYGIVYRDWRDMVHPDIFVIIAINEFSVTPAERQDLKN